MLEIVTGGSGSGKSEYAENLAVGMRRSGGELIYVAAMKPFDQECERRIERHRDMRKGKGFRTVECYEDVQELEIPYGATVLLECMSNLLANEMYSSQCGVREGLSSHLMRGIEHLWERSENVVVVTNEVFSDGIDYGEEMVEYVRCLGKINCEMARKADHVTEVVCKIPIRIK